MFSQTSSPEVTSEPDTTPLEPIADYVYLGRSIITMDQATSRADAVAVAGNSIVAVGTEAEVMRHAAPATAVIRLGAAALLPGFVDAHSHFFGNPDRAGGDTEAVSDFVLSNGITTTAEMHTTPDILAGLEQLAADGRLGVRTSAYLIAVDACGNVQDEWWRAHPPTRSAGEKLRIGGVKIFADGGACNVPAVSYEYLNGLGHGDLYFGAGELARMIGRISDAGHQVAIHALGDRAIDAVLGGYQQVLGSGSGNPLRHRLEHSAATRPDQRDLHGQIGVVTTIFGAFQACFYSGQLGAFKGRTPPEFLEWEWPWRELLAENPGAHFGWHNDFPVFEPSAVKHLAGFVTRGQVAPDGAYCEPLPDMAGHAISVEQALQLMTMGAAYALGRDDEVGSLSAGKLADMVILSADPRTVEPHALHELKVLATIIDGKVGWCADGSAGLCPPAGLPPTGTPAAATSAPSLAPGPNVALGATAAATAELSGSPASNAVDGNLETIWNAGAQATQSITIDLGRTRSVRLVRLVVAQSPVGNTVHRLFASADDGERLLHEFSGTTEDGERLDLTFADAQPVRRLRIETSESPSWVAWREIEAYE